MKITDLRAYSIRIDKSETASSVGAPSNSASDDSSFRPTEDRPPVDDFGDYFIDQSAFTSIYSHHHETTVVRLETDTGIVGWGEAQSPVAPRVTRTIFEELIRPLVIGRDPFDIEAIWTRAYGASTLR